MSALPSFSDIFFIILIVLPGYVTTKILRNIGGLKRRMPDAELLYSSLIFSLIIYSIIGYIFQINDYEGLKNEVLKPYSIPTVLFTTIGVGIIFGIVIYGWRWYNNVVPDDAWTSVIKDYANKYDDTWVIIYTSDGKEYKGSLDYWGIEHEPRELTIKEPYRILMNENFKLIEDVYMGDEMYFSEKDILRMLFMNQEPDDK